MKRFSEIGSRLGIGFTRVLRKRKRLGVPTVVARLAAAEIALLGTDTDRNIAILLGRTEEAVKLRHWKKDIAAHR